MKREADHHSAHHLGYHSTASSGRPPPLGSPHEEHAPKLGDFAKLQASVSSLLLGRQRQSEPSPVRHQSLDAHDDVSPRSRQTPLISETPTSLGNFSKVFNQLHPSATRCIVRGDACSVAVFDITQAPACLSDSPLYPKATRLGLRNGSPGTSDANNECRSSPLWAQGKVGRNSFLPIPIPRLSPSLDLELDSELEMAMGLDAGIITPTTTPPTSLEWCPSPLAIDIPKQRSVTQPQKEPQPKTSNHVSQPPYSSPTVKHLFSYRLVKHGHLIPVYDLPRTKSEKHESLSLKLASIRAEDALMAVCRPSVVSNGVHVFLDMSNINISFHKALRKKYAILDRARFTPLPPLSLEFLTEILVRNRNTKTLHAGCSVHPGSHKPRYIHDLWDLGYHVDLRERKPVETSQAAPHQKSSGSSSEEVSWRRFSSIRYVEDLVDETLQTRIAESVMEYFQDQGTLVLATGDAQPAKYSDGFFTYAERALRMGWNVEVVSWKSSLSSHWKNPGWSGQWGDRFRIIELDDFVDDVLACYL